MRAKILVVEDDPAIQELITFNLSRAGYQVMRANDGETAESLLQSTLPALLIVDWMLPGKTGVALIRSLRARSATRDLPIIMMTARTSEQDMVSALECGADDYIKKPFSPREMLARVHTILRRLSPQNTETSIEIRGLRLDPVKHRVCIGHETVDMSPTEFRLLHFFMSHPDRVHTRNSLIDKVWGSDALINERTVDAHVGRLRGTLEKAGHDIKIETIRGLGYCFPASNASSISA